MTSPRSISAPPSPPLAHPPLSVHAYAAFAASNCASKAASCSMAKGLGASVLSWFKNLVVGFLEVVVCNLQIFRVVHLYMLSGVGG